MSTRFPVSCEVAFDYLVDPRNRPAWQGSLKRVEQVDGDVRVGQTWVDVTRPGLRPRMETTELDRPHRWTERGTWRGYAATLTLTFTERISETTSETSAETTSETTPGCDVDASVVITGPWVSLLRRIAPRAVRRDLRHAADMLTP